MASENLMCAGRQLIDNSCLVTFKSTRLLRQGSADYLAKMFFLLLARCAAIMATLDVYNRRTEPQNGFLSTLSILSTAVLGHFHCIQ
ncbi:hypothetical protein DPMN_138983 [Dreissena polymorpha]|uniref:Uncharacterized protein n=1 Tax=Dreissena polymorpha TaxID=45954 RepID=A0A9D4JG39_DREPO|nr:hypothetical protein DPMN_138983 [Dreissena polymorpha]